MHTLHPWIVSGLHAGILGLEWSAVVKVALAAVLRAAMSFALGRTPNKVPGMRVILGTSAPEPSATSGIARHIPPWREPACRTDVAYPTPR